MRQRTICARAEDVALPEAAGRATSEEDLRELPREYWIQFHLHGSWLVKLHKLRFSGNRLLRVFARVMGGGGGSLGD